MNIVQNHSVEVQSLGLKDYQETWDYQEQLFKSVVDLKLANRDLPEQEQNETPNYLLFVEHPHVYTLGKSGHESNLLLNEDGLKEKHATYYKINRGGDITYHGPGQIVGYPIFDLDCFFTDVHKYVRFLEEAVILTIAEYGLKGKREKGYTGVWLEGNRQQPKRKICAIGVHLSRWVTMHGFAFNINTQLSHFENIIPCGIEDKDKDVTSLARELGGEVSIDEVKGKLRQHFASLFGFEFTGL